MRSSAVSSIYFLRCLCRRKVRFRECLVSAGRRLPAADKMSCLSLDILLPLAPFLEKVDRGKKRTSHVAWAVAQSIAMNCLQGSHFLRDCACRCRSHTVARATLHHRKQRESVARQAKCRIAPPNRPWQSGPDPSGITQLKLLQAGGGSGALRPLERSAPTSLCVAWSVVGRKASCGGGLPRELHAFGGRIGDGGRGRGMLGRVRRVLEVRWSGSTKHGPELRA